MANTLLGFAESFVSFLLQNLEESDLSRISSVLLFGSTARGEARPGSDIDIFVVTGFRGIKGRIEALKERFYESETYRRYWRLIGVKNEIKLICDELSNWPSLRKSILNDGIVLYGKYAEPVEKQNPHILIWWDRISNQSMRVLLSKQLYGYNLKGKNYKGLLSKTKGCQKIGTNTLLVPIQGFGKFRELFDRHKIQFRQKLVAKIE